MSGMHAGMHNDVYNGMSEDMHDEMQQLSVPLLKLRELEHHRGVQLEAVVVKQKIVAVRHEALNSNEHQRRNRTVPQTANRSATVSAAVSAMVGAMVAMSLGHIYTHAHTNVRLDHLLQN